MTGSGRRSFLLGLGAAATGLLVRRGVSYAQDASAIAPANAAERLMSEHGVVQRLMICFDEAAGKLETDAPVPASAVLGAGAIVDEFVEAYHEELEEQHIFKALDGQEDLAPLILTLRRQHAAGRTLAGRIIEISGEGALIETGRRRALAAFCSQYARMYRAHAAYEDTVLVPGLRSLLGPDAFADLNGQVREFARATLGTSGLDDVLGRVNAVQQELGIGRLEDFTATT
jgi:hemerythrin-like domain-containing protein